jgi:ATP-dependent protease Clp ATPase subunit
MTQVMYEVPSDKSIVKVIVNDQTIKKGSFLN